MTTPTPTLTDARGAELFDLVMSQIKAHPEFYQQEWWATWTPCGTTYCVAGWAVALVYGEDSILFDVDAAEAHDVRINGQGRTIPDVAAELLRLPCSGCAWHLFAADNSLEQISDFFAMIKDGEHCCETNAGHSL